MKYVIPLEPRTKKNHSMIVRGRLIPSKEYAAYRRDAIMFLKPLPAPIDYPVNVKALYYMKTRRRVDLNNLHSALMDILVDAEVLLDDNAKIVAGTDGSRVLYDKENPRTEVFIEKLPVDREENEQERMQTIFE